VNQVGDKEIIKDSILNMGNLLKMARCDMFSHLKGRTNEREKESKEREK
jgi:hypothetical protein